MLYHAVCVRLGISNFGLQVSVVVDLNFHVHDEKVTPFKGKHYQVHYLPCKLFTVVPGKWGVIWQQRDQKMETQLTRTLVLQRRGKGTWLNPWMVRRYYVISACRLTSSLRLYYQSWRFVKAT